MDKEGNAAIAAWAKAEAAARGMTQRQLCEHVPGWTSDLVSRSLKGSRMIQGHELVALMRLFGYAIPIVTPGAAESPTQRLVRLASSLGEDQQRALLVYLEALHSQR